MLSRLAWDQRSFDPERDQNQQGECPMNILITVASKHGSTRGIGDAIADELQRMGLTVGVRNAEDVDDVDGYDAAIVGSAIYMGNWLPEARQFVDRNQSKLATMPVWLFSSGPLGLDDPQPNGDPAHLDALMKETGARDHRIFVGKLDKHGLGLGERLAVKMVKAPEGDFRDWEAIRGWAREIGSALQGPTVAGD
jgi:menaquinone-dependent protoporphyrinogen oxidase